MVIYDGDEEDLMLAKIVLPNATRTISPSQEPKYARGWSSSSVDPFGSSSSHFPPARLRVDL
jgi:hypothetical protein